MDEIIEYGCCYCGCGEKTTVYRKKPQKFIYGHQARGKNNSRYGLKMGDELKNKISESKKGKTMGEDNHFFGKTHTEVTRKLISENNKKWNPITNKQITCLHCKKEYATNYLKSNKVYCTRECQNRDFEIRFAGENNPFFGQKHTQEVIDAIKENNVKFRAISTRGKVTKPELALQRCLERYNILFIAEQNINNKFCVDIFIPSMNLIIFMDGCYWHNCPIHFPNGKVNKTRQTDKSRIPYLTKCGYDVVIIWEHDVKHLDSIVSELLFYHLFVN